VWRCGLAAVADDGRLDEPARTRDRLALVAAASVDTDVVVAVAVRRAHQTLVHV